MQQLQLNNVLEYVSFITRMRDIVTSENVIQALYQASLTEWEKAKDADTGEHLIQGVFTSTGKSELTKSYIARLIKIYMTSTGFRLTAWTKDTISSDNTTNVAIGNRIAATMFNDNLELFTLVVTRLIGMDDMLVKFALEADPSAKALHLLDYLSADFDLSITTVNKDELRGDTVVRQSNKDNYPVAFDYLVENFEKGAFTPEYFAQHVAQASMYFSTLDRPVDLWDDFTYIDPMVDVQIEHSTFHPVSLDDHIHREPTLAGDTQALNSPTKGKFGELDLPDLPDDPVLINRDNGAEPVLNKANENLDIPVAVDTDGKGVPALETDYTGNVQLNMDSNAAASQASVEIAENALEHGAPLKAVMNATTVDFDMILTIDDEDPDPRTTIEVVLQNFKSVKIVVPAERQATPVEEAMINDIVKQARDAGRNVEITWQSNTPIEKVLA